MLPTVRPALDPLAQRAAINALEAQRAAYQRYARTVEDQSRAVGGGDPDRAAAASDVAARGADELDAGVRALAPHLARVREEGSPDQQAEVQRHLELLANDAEHAQTAIQNLTAQLDAWRVAYGRQLASAGLAPSGFAGAGTTPSDGRSAATAAAPSAGESGRSATRPAQSRGVDGRSYGPRGQVTGATIAPKLLNRLG